MGLWDDVKRQAATAKKALDESGLKEEAARRLGQTVELSTAAKHRWKVSQTGANWRCGPCGYPVDISTATMACPTCGAGSILGNVNRAQWRSLTKLWKDKENAGHTEFEAYLLNHWFGYPNFVHGLTEAEITRREATAQFLVTYGGTYYVFRDGRFDVIGTGADARAERRYLSGTHFEVVGPDWALNRDPQVPVSDRVDHQMRLALSVHAVMGGAEPDPWLLSEVDSTLRTLDRWTRHIKLKWSGDPEKRTLGQWQKDMGPFVLLGMFGRDQSWHLLSGATGKSPLQRWLEKVSAKDDGAMMLAAIHTVTHNWYGAAKTLAESGDSGYMHIMRLRSLTRTIARIRLAAEIDDQRDRLERGDLSDAERDAALARIAFSTEAARVIETDNPYSEIHR